MHPSIRFLFAFATLIPAQAVLGDTSDDGGNIKVDVVVDLPDAGRRVVRPTPGQPAYYLPLTIGYKEIGHTRDFQRPPPPPPEVEHELAVALFDQGYRLMTKRDQPTLVLVLAWGYMAPDQVDMNEHQNTTRPGALVQGPRNGFGGWGSGVSAPTISSQGGVVPGLDDSVTGAGDDTSAFSIGTMSINEMQMQALVAGDTLKYPQKWEDPRIDAVLQMAKEPRYYLLVSAFDFQSWLRHKPVLLWRAHVSTELWGHYFDQVVGTLITTAAPYFGRETKMPQLISSPTAPLGRVRVGTPEVTNYEK